MEVAVPENCDLGFPAVPGATSSYYLHSSSRRRLRSIIFRTCASIRAKSFLLNSSLGRQFSCASFFREVAVCGAEIEAEVKIRIAVLNGRPLPLPFLDSGDAVYTISSEVELKDAVTESTRMMRDWLADESTLDPTDALIAPLTYRRYSDQPDRRPSDDRPLPFTEEHSRAMRGGAAVRRRSEFLGVRAGEDDSVPCLLRFMRPISEFPAKKGSA